MESCHAPQMAMHPEAAVMLAIDSPDLARCRCHDGAPMDYALCLHR